jgi:hypothetical protein
MEENKVPNLNNYKSDLTIYAEKESAYVYQNGYLRLGPRDVEIKIDLTDQEKIELGEQMSNCLIEAERLLLEKKAYDKDMASQIEQQNMIATDSSKRLKLGYRVEEKTYPCYLDESKAQRVYYDFENQVEVKREPMTEQDKQGVFID